MGQTDNINRNSTIYQQPISKRDVKKEISWQNLDKSECLGILPSFKSITNISWELFVAEFHNGSELRPDFHSRSPVVVETPITIRASGRDVGYIRQLPPDPSGSSEAESRVALKETFWWVISFFPRDNKDWRSTTLIEVWKPVLNDCFLSN